MRRMLGLVVLAACGGDPGGSSSTETTSEDTAGTGADTGEATAADEVGTDTTPPTTTTTETTDAETTGDTGDEEDTGETGMPAPDCPVAGKGGFDDGHVRFVAFGDTGEGNEAQFKVGEAAAALCDQCGCDLALLLGDNFYDDGVTSLDDPQFMTKFEDPYAAFDIPFWVVMGNHDYGDTLPDFDRSSIQIAYSDMSDKWTMPSEWYTFKEGSSTPVDFLAFDTMRIMFSDSISEQEQFVDSVLAASTSDWRISFSHHPYLSNGQHGNAGNYEGLPFIPILAGSTIKEFMDDHVCGKVDVYICGHDHNRASFSASASQCGVELLVDGASAKTSDFENRDGNDTLWSDDTKEGFVWIELRGDTMTAAWFDLDGNLDFQYEVTK